MRFRHLLPLLLVVLTASLAALLSAQRAPAAAPVQLGTTRVGIANPSKIFDAMQEKKVYDAQLKARGKEMAAQEQQMRQDLEKMLADRGQFNPKSDAYHATTRQIFTAKAAYESRAAQDKAAIEQDRKEMLIKLYQKIEAASAEVAEKYGIGLVMVDGRQEIPNLEDAPYAEVSRVIGANHVLSAAKEIDISEQIITLLDQKYAQAGAGK